MVGRGRGNNSAQRRSSNDGGSTPPPVPTRASTRTKKAPKRFDSEHGDKKRPGSKAGTRDDEEENLSFVGEGDNKEARANEQTDVKVGKRKDSAKSVGSLSKGEANRDTFNSQSSTASSKKADSQATAHIEGINEIVKTDASNAASQRKSHHHHHHHGQSKDHHSSDDDSNWLKASDDDDENAAGSGDEDSNDENDSNSSSSSQSSSSKESRTTTEDDRPKSASDSVSKPKDSTAKEGGKQAVNMEADESERSVTKRSARIAQKRQRQHEHRPHSSHRKPKNEGGADRQTRREDGHHVGKKRRRTSSSTASVGDKEEAATASKSDSQSISLQRVADGGKAGNRADVMGIKQPKLSSQDDAESTGGTATSTTAVNLAPIFEHDSADATVRVPNHSATGVHGASQPGYVNSASFARVGLPTGVRTPAANPIVPVDQVTDRNAAFTEYQSNNMQSSYSAPSLGSNDLSIDRKRSDSMSEPTQHASYEYSYARQLHAKDAEVPRIRAGSSDSTVLLSQPRVEPTREIAQPRGTSDGLTGVDNRDVSAGEKQVAESDVIDVDDDDDEEEEDGEDGGNSNDYMTTTVKDSAMAGNEFTLLHAVDHPDMPPPTGQLGHADQTTTSNSLSVTGKCIR
jgi:hypothetical protein